jgi:hypothetical protein
MIVRRRKGMRGGGGRSESSDGDLFLRWVCDWSLDRLGFGRILFLR